MMNTAEDAISRVEKASLRAIQRVKRACYRALEGLFCEKSMLTAAPSDLPWDIVTDILSRLPVKSLMRFKCVSTSFYNLISNDPVFKKKHLYHHQSSFLQVLIPDQPDTPIESATNSCCISYVSPAGDAREEIIDLEFPIQIGLDRYGCIYNSCDGLFCIGVDGGDVIIWNPSTRQAKRFPCGHRDDERGHMITYSLAHDSRSNVYKLLGVFDENIRLRFYSTEMKMWRCVEDCPPRGADIRFGGEPTVGNGAFHWLSLITPHVVSLDIHDETYGLLAMPKSFCAFPSVLCEWKGKLCVMCQTNSWEMWVMNEYGVADSMTRMFSFSRDELPIGFCRPLYTPDKNTDLLLIYGDTIGTSFYKDGIRVLSDPIGRISCTFFESLVSPHTCLEKVSSTEIVIANKRFSATDNLHSHNALPEIVENTSSGKNFLKRLCFCKSF